MGILPRPPPTPPPGVQLGESPPSCYRWPSCAGWSPARWGRTQPGSTHGGGSTHLGSTHAGEHSCRGALIGGEHSLGRTHWGSTLTGLYSLGSTRAGDYSCLGAVMLGSTCWGSTRAGLHSLAEHSCWAALGEHSGRTRWGEHLLGEHSCLGAVMLGSTCWGSTSARWPSLLQRDSSNHGMTKEIQSHLCLPEFPVPEAKLSTTCRPQPSRPGRQPSALCPHFWWAAAFHTQHAATSKPSSVSIPGQVPSEHP